MRLRFGLNYSLRWAFVDSLFRIMKKRKVSSPAIMSQSMESWRTFAMLRFCFHNKIVEVRVGDFLSVEMDKLDEEFFRLAMKLGSAKWGIWNKVYNWLEQGETREEVLKRVKTYAIARGLKP